MKCDQGVQVFEETQKSIQDIIGDVYCPTCAEKNGVHLSISKKKQIIRL